MSGTCLCSFSYRALGKIIRQFLIYSFSDCCFKPTGMLIMIKCYDLKCSAFFGLKKRTESQFREERVHRLLVPALFLTLTSGLFCSLDYFSKLSPNCEEYYQWKNIREQLHQIGKMFFFSKHWFCHRCNCQWFYCFLISLQSLSSSSQFKEWVWPRLAILWDEFCFSKQRELRGAFETILLSTSSQSRMVPPLSLCVFSDIGRPLRLGSPWPPGI